MSPRVRRRRRLTIAGAVTASCALVLVCVLVGVTYVPDIRIANTALVGSVSLPEHLVRAYVDTFDATLPHAPFRRDNVALFPRTGLERGIEESFPRVAAASVSVTGLVAPVRTITLTERIPFARWCEDGGSPCFLMDEEGVIFAYDAGEGVISPVNFSGGEVLASSARIGRTYSPHFRSLAVLAGAMDRRGLRITSATLGGGYATLVTEEGFRVRAPIKDTNPEALVSVLELSLASEPLRGKSSMLEYIDLRFGNRVYYRFIRGEGTEVLDEEGPKAVE